VSKSSGARCGHVKRLLNQGKPLTPELLEFVLDGMNENTGDQLLDGICRKLRAGESLSDYEHHIVVDVLLLHMRLHG
jgi:hypothetical protein